MVAIESRMKQGGGGGGGGGGPVDPNLLARLDQLEKNKGAGASPDVVAKLALMEQQLMATQVRVFCKFLVLIRI